MVVIFQSHHPTCKLFYNFANKRKKLVKCDRRILILTAHDEVYNKLLLYLYYVKENVFARFLTDKSSIQ